MPESPFAVQTRHVYFQNLTNTLENSKFALPEPPQPFKRAQITIAVRCKFFLPTSFQPLEIVDRVRFYQQVISGKTEQKKQRTTPS
jgi:hypothetical protein